MRKLMLIGPLAVVMSSMLLCAQQREEKKEQLRDDLVLAGLGQMHVVDGSLRVIHGPSDAVSQLDDLRLQQRVVAAGFDPLKGLSGSTAACRSTYEAAQSEMQRDHAPDTSLTPAKQDEVTRLFAALANAKLWLAVKPDAPAVVSAFCSPGLLKSIPARLADLHARKLLMGAQERLAYQTADEARQVREDGIDLRKALQESGGGEPPR